MKIIYTIGFAQKNAEQFFNKLDSYGVEILIDTRISNNTQMAGYTKSGDIEFFLKKICGIKYDYRPDFAPTKELLKDWRTKQISWNEYEEVYNSLIESRGRYKNFLDDYAQYTKVCILCSEATPEFCHRRLLAEKLEKEFSGEVAVIHL